MSEKPKIYEETDDSDLRKKINCYNKHDILLSCCVCYDVLRSVRDYEDRQVDWDIVNLTAGRKDNGS